MKKIVTIGALALAGCMLFGLAGCSPEQRAAEALVSKQVTEEQWNTAFGDQEGGLLSATANYSVEYVEAVSTDGYVDSVRHQLTQITVYDIERAGDVSRVTAQQKQTGKYGSVSLNYDGPVEESVISKDTNTVYSVYNKTADGYTSIVANNEPAIDLLGKGVDMLGTSNYADYVYSETCKGYILEDDLAGEGYIIKFDEQGRLAAVWKEETSVESPSTSSESHRRVTHTVSIVFHYDQVTITVPQVAQAQ